MSGDAELVLWRAFEQSARSHADATAFVDGTTTVTYQYLYEGARARAASLRTALDGSNGGDGEAPALIALVAAEPLATLEWLFGALSIGASVAPITRSGVDHVELLHTLRPDVTVMCTEAATLSVDAGGIGPAATRSEPIGARRLPPGTLPPGVIIGTAGTTGAPKAVVHSHATLGHAVRRLQLFRLASSGTPGRIPADEQQLADDLLEAAAAPALSLRYATTLPLSTMAGLTVAFQALLAGDSMTLPPTSDPATLLDAAISTGVTNLSLTPLLAQLLLRAAKRAPARDFDQLLFVGIGGGPVHADLPAALEAALGCPVAVGYGTTESGGALAMALITDPPEVRHATVGRALPGVELTIDPESSELSVACASIALGYVTRTTAFTDLRRHTYPTGDRARLRPDGALELFGRVDDLILRAGRNIDPARIERVLEAHPAVQRAAAFGVSNPTLAGEQDIWSAVVLERGVAEAELRSHCHNSLGPSLTPRRVIPVDELPLTADGAVRRQQLATLADRRAFARAEQS